MRRRPRIRCGFCARSGGRIVAHCFHCGTALCQKHLEWDLSVPVPVPCCRRCNPGEEKAA